MALAITTIATFALFAASVYSIITPKSTAEKATQWFLAVCVCKLIMTTSMAMGPNRENAFSSQSSPNICLFACQH